MRRFNMVGMMAEVGYSFIFLMELFGEKKRSELPYFFYMYLNELQRFPSAKGFIFEYGKP